MVGGKKNSNSSDSSSSANNNNNRKNTKEEPPNTNSPISNDNPSPSSPSPFLNNPSNDDDNSGGGKNNEPYHTPYAFNGRIVIGIGVILAIAAAGTIYAMTVSQSPAIHVSLNGAGGNSGSPLLVGSAAGQQQQQMSSQKIDKSFVLVARDFGWNGSANGPTIRVNKGDTVRLTVINAGQMAHNFGMGKPSQETLRLLNETKDLPYAQRMQQIPYSVMQAMPCPGCQKEFEKGHIEFFILPDAQATTVFTADEAGQFKYFCMVRGHIWLGMYGDFIVDNGPISTVSATIAKGAGGMS